MKKSWLLSVCLLWCCVGGLQAQNSLFDKYSDMDGVDYVYVSKSMMNSIFKYTETIVLSNEIIPKIDCVQIISCDGENRETLTMMRKDIAAYEKKSKENGMYKVVMKSKSDGELILILWKEDKKENMNEYLLLMSSEDECTIISITGAFSYEDLKKQSVIGDNI